MASYIKEGIEHAGLIVKKYYCPYVNNQIDQLMNVDAIVFGSPTYFGAASFEMKKFMDLTSGIWQKQLWQNKIAAAFTYSSCLNGDKLSVLQQFFIFAQQHGMIWVGLNTQCDINKEINYLGSWSGLMALSPKKSEQFSYSRAIDEKTAQYFGYRIGTITQSFNF